MNLCSAEYFALKTLVFPNEQRETTPALNALYVLIFFKKPESFQTFHYIK